MAKTILFDLDGTLTDPATGITRSVAHALRHYGIEVSDLSTLHPFIGPPLDESFERFYGFSHERAVEAIGYYREYFRDTGIFENEVYPGIPELLGALRDAGKTLAVATSKPEVFAIRILEHFGLIGFFSTVVGSELDGTRVKKHEVIEEALRRTGAPETDVVMVGDREHDVLGAKCAGIPCIGVLYGYGSAEELTATGATTLAESPEALFSVLMQ